MKSKILITDECPDVSAVDEFHDVTTKKDDRGQTVAKWILGHACDVMQEYDPEWVSIIVGGRAFRDRRAEYPSEKLVADLCLAIYAGEGLAPSAFQIKDLDDLTVVEVLTNGVSPFAYRGGKP